MASFGLMGTKPHKPSETIYHFLTSEFEIEMIVEYFAKSSIKSFHFRDSLNGGRFCLSAEGRRIETVWGGSRDQSQSPTTISRHAFVHRCP